MESPIRGSTPSLQLTENEETSNSRQPMTGAAFLRVLASWTAVLLEAAPADLRAAGLLRETAESSVGPEADKTRENIELCSQFVSDTASSVLYVIQQDGTLNSGTTEPIEGTQTDIDPESSTQSLNYSIQTSLPHTFRLALAVIKGSARIYADTRPETQLQLFVTPGTGAPNSDAAYPSYDLLKSLINFGLGPYFDVLADDAINGSLGPPANSATRRSEQTSEPDSAVRAARRKITELVLSLQSLERKISVPDLLSSVHPAIRAAAEAAEAAEATGDATEATGDATGDSVAVANVPASLIADPAFLNALQASVNSWVKASRQISRLDRSNADDDSAATEIHFWTALEEALHTLQARLNHRTIKLTLAILKQGKRFHSTVSFLSDTGVTEAVARAEGYNQLLRDFPIDGMLAAPSFAAVAAAVAEIFTHLKKLRFTIYPVPRALCLCESVSGDLARKLTELLGTNVAQLPYSEYSQLISEIEPVFTTWDKCAKEFTNLAREILRKRAEKFIFVRIKARHTEIQSRLQYFTDFRRRHQELHTTLIGAQNHTTELVAQLQEAYATVENVDIVDLSPEGLRKWSAAEAQYKAKVAQVEAEIIGLLRSALGRARTADETFRVFARFRPLLARPAIRGAVAEYQTLLLGNVQEETSALRAQLGDPSRVRHASAVQGIPTVAAEILWLKQLQSRLDDIVARLELILGTNWPSYAEGQPLHAEIVALRAELRPDELFLKWQSAVAGRSFPAHFHVVAVRKTQSNSFTAVAQLDPLFINLAAETRNLAWLGFQVPHSVVSAARTVGKVLPTYLALTDAFRVLSTVLPAADSVAVGRPLLAPAARDVLKLLRDAGDVTWDEVLRGVGAGSLGPSEFADAEAQPVLRLLDGVFRFHELFRRVDSAAVRIEARLSELGVQKESGGAAEISHVISALQAEIEQLSVLGVAPESVAAFTAELNRRIAENLARRAAAALNMWAEQLWLSSAAPLTAELVVAENSVLVSPPLEQIRVNLYSEVQEIVEQVAQQEALQSRGRNSSSKSRFPELESRVAQQVAVCYTEIDKLYANATARVREWQQFQALWDISPDTVFAELGSELPRWLSLLVELRKARLRLDTLDLGQQIGRLRLGYEQIAARVALKYDSLQAATVAQFGSVVAECAEKLCSELKPALQQLVAQHISATDVFRTAEIISDVHKLQSRIESWRTRATELRKAHSVLARNRFRFGPDWIFPEQTDTLVENVAAELAARNAEISSRTAEISADIVRHSEATARSAEQLKSRWNREKPIGGSVAPSVALSELAKFKAELSAVTTRMRLLESAARLLETSAAELPPLADMSDEIAELEAVWSELHHVDATLDTVKARKLSDIAPRELRADLEALARQLRAVPSSVRQFAAYETLTDTVRNLSKTLPVLGLLRSDALQPRHWQSLALSLGLSSSTPQEAQLGELWAQDLLRHKKLVADIVAQAQGEQILQEAVGKLVDRWADRRFETVPNSGAGGAAGPSLLVKGWDSLFAACRDDLAELEAMRASAFYPVVATEARAWTDKLGKVAQLLDVWVDVQRQWVYLDRVLGSETEVARLQPRQAARFRAVSAEWLSHHRNLLRAGSVVAAAELPGVQEAAERAQEAFGRVQRALAEYLERARAEFPRFYFVGNEDLLEVLGTGADVAGAEKHLRKLYPGVARVEVAESGRIVAVESPEGEKVALQQSVAVEAGAVSRWLGELGQNVAHTLEARIAEAWNELQNCAPGNRNAAWLRQWMAKFPYQALLVAQQLFWTHETELWLSGKDGNNGNNATATVSYDSLNEQFSELRNALAEIASSESVGQGNPDNSADDSATSATSATSIVASRKTEMLIAETIHQSNILAELSATTPAPHLGSYTWLKHQRVYLRPDHPVGQRILIRQLSSEIPYGLEYLGVPERLVYTPLTSEIFQAMISALTLGMGGCPFGPAGTGKTETVKMLGQNLGRLVLVFNCDDSFDFQAVGRILVGISRLGAWGCFDEFNRLTGNVLSAVSAHIEALGLGLRGAAESGLAGAVSGTQITLLGQSFVPDPRTGLFITMNPGYAGRSALPENLKKLFRSFSVARPDKETIVEVVLAGLGFKNGSAVAQRIVPLFARLSEELSEQKHYDFGLRALKSVLGYCGALRRELWGLTGGLTGGAADTELELRLVGRSVDDTVAPKLTDADLPIFRQLRAEFLPPDNLPDTAGGFLREFTTRCATQHYIAAPQFIRKAQQLARIHRLHTGIVIVGPAGSGKSVLGTLTAQSLAAAAGTSAEIHRLDPKLIGKEALFGRLDAATREWTDGVVARLIRKVRENLRQEAQQLIWILFDGDIDPDWAEALNSVLDDNRTLTLASGERLPIPDNVRFVFEVDSLRHATPATVSRCGMLYVGSATVTDDMSLQRYLRWLKAAPAGDLTLRDGSEPDAGLLEKFADTVAELVAPHLVRKVAQFSCKLRHVMPEAGDSGKFDTFTAFVSRYAAEFAAEFSGRPAAVAEPALEPYAARAIVMAFVWAYAGDCEAEERAELVAFLAEAAEAEAELVETEVRNAENPANTNTETEANSAEISPSSELPVLGTKMRVLALYAKDPTGSDNSSASASTSASASASILSYHLTPHSFIPFSDTLPTTTLPPEAVADPTTVVPTSDTAMHQDIVLGLLALRKPVILCGPPGSGKTMTLLNAVRGEPQLELLSLNFCKQTTPQQLVAALEQKCRYTKAGSGWLLGPETAGSWLVVLCDEVNLPEADQFGTQHVAAFLRGCVAQGGFWSLRHKSWVSLNRVQFVAACNPPTDPGRIPLAARFIRHAAVVAVGYPGEQSLRQIYSTFVSAVLRTEPDLYGFAEPVTETMLAVYAACKRQFSQLPHPRHAHYVYSPRELTRWSRALLRGVAQSDRLSANGLIRLVVHEARRLFADRLVAQQEQLDCATLISTTTETYFPGGAVPKPDEPLLYSDWLTGVYAEAPPGELRSFVQQRLALYAEEELETPLVLFEGLLDHVLRVDRVLRQPQGHVILLGPAGSGRATIARFAAWLNGLTLRELPAYSGFGLPQFDHVLRAVLREAAVSSSRVCLLVGETGLAETAFVERMNTLLANAEVPGLFAGAELTALLAACRDAVAARGLLLDTEEELMRWFRDQLAENLHVVFVVEAQESQEAQRSQKGKKSGAAALAASPALLNRCVVDFVSAWPQEARQEVAETLLPAGGPAGLPAAAAAVHGVADAAVAQYVAFLRLVQHRHSIVVAEHTEAQHHLHTGLGKIKDTAAKVAQLRRHLATQSEQLDRKAEEAQQTLRHMITEQNEAERKAEASQEIQKLLERQEAELSIRQAEVRAELAAAEPAVKAAELGVRNIKKQHLTELRAMANPPEAVKTTLEAVCLLLGRRLGSWREILGATRSDEFIPAIVHFDCATQLPGPRRAELAQRFLNRPEFQPETVTRASKACGPLCLWVRAQLAYAEALEQVGPLREEVAQLEAEARANEAKLRAVDEMLEELDGRIARYRDEYSAVIAESERIKAEVAEVQARIGRSVELVASLQAETERWRATLKESEAQRATLAGDATIMAAFAVYAGSRDEAQRGKLVAQWRQILAAYGVPVAQHNLNNEQFAAPRDVAQWNKNGLPINKLSLQNYFIITTAPQYPLIIDPTPQCATALQFLRQRHPNAAIVSCRDPSLAKHTENALRFGGALILTEAEAADPLLGPVLAREYRRIGGRRLVRLGAREVDVAESFRLFLVAADASAQWPRQVTARTTVVTFSLSAASLATEAADAALAEFFPAEEAQQRAVAQQLGDLAAQLTEKEKALLEELGNAEGNLLENDSVAQSLAKLKQEAENVAQQRSAAEDAAAAVQNVASKFRPFGSAAAGCFRALQRLETLSHWYRFGLKWMRSAVVASLRAARAHGVAGRDAGDAERLCGLFAAEVYRRASVAVLGEHRGVVAGCVTVGLLISRCGAAVRAVAAQVMAAVVAQQPIGPAKAELATVAQQDSLDASDRAMISTLELLIKAIEAGGAAETDTDATVPSLVHQLEAQLAEAAGLPISATEPYTLQEIIVAQLGKETPLILCSPAGFDATTAVKSLAAQLNRKLEIVALGTAETLATADTLLRHAAQNGTWLLVQNVHTWPQWLAEIGSFSGAAEGFQLFFTTEVSFTEMPSTLLQQSRLFVFDNIQGLGPSLRNLLTSGPAAAALQRETPPTERKFICFLLSWFHALVAERLNYVPLSWKTEYEFSDSDLDAGIRLAEIAVAQSAAGKAHLLPQTIPWSYIAGVVGGTVYAGKVADAEDAEFIRRLAARLFRAEAFDSEFNLVANEFTEQLSQSVNPPERKQNVADFINWATNLPEPEPVTWLGLPTDAEAALRVMQERKMVADVAQVLTGMIEEVEEEEGEEETEFPGQQEPQGVNSE